MRRARAWVLVWCATATVAGAADDAGFERQVAPVLVRHCVGCHNASDPSGGLNLTRAGPRPGRRRQRLAGHQSRRSRAKQLAGADPRRRNAARGQGLARRGRRAGSARKLDPSPGPVARRSRTEHLRIHERHARRPRLVVARSAGAPAGSRGAHSRPSAHSDRRLRLGRARSAGLDAFGRCRPRATLIRRATLDLLGLPPTPEEIEQFVADPAPDAYERLVDRLLASPRYGERWARHWLDVVRFGESNGYETNTARPNAWPYRDWVIQAFNDDMPYRQFIFEQLAGDQVGVDAATGFLVGGAHDTVGSPDVELTLAQRMNDLDDMVSTTAARVSGTDRRLRQVPRPQVRSDRAARLLRAAGDLCRRAAWRARAAHSRGASD